uniref:conserved oligomeric Golgi complex subunit 3 n=1 Tax=Ciona intestinalis TaxID=7719 RepID=UPI0002B8E924|nr:conserved oligomeric Golgi complex subunit 3 [Ciona intestinalis]|eukprot:XP_018668391.1 conserved oligomeric Golgi complex subunit 3 [Ciona intestinalis]
MASDHISTISTMERLSLWNATDNTGLATLNELQQDSFLELAAIGSNRALPIEVPLTEPVNITPNVLDSHAIPGSVEDVLTKGFTKLGMAGEKIENAQQFYSWFSQIEEEVRSVERKRFTEHVETLKQHREYCQYITQDVNKALQYLDDLEKEYVYVSTKSNALHEACEHLLADQTALFSVAETIHENLDYFNEVSRMNTKLSSPNISVTSEDFRSMLSKIEECIEFMQAHPAYKDSAEYVIKYKTCLTKALGMIKLYVVNSLESTKQAILNRKSGGDAGQSVGSEAFGSGNDAFTLYYGKFRTNAPKIKALMEQIEQRSVCSQEYQQIVVDIHQCYFTQRETLLSPSVTSAMLELLNANKQDHCALVRSGCSFMVHVCEDEHQLYGHFFSSQSKKLYEMLLRLCGNLYDMLRPLIIHVYHLETLAELCNILKMEMIDDHVQNNPEQLQAFHSVALQMLEDVQERLVFRANIHIRDDIRGYKPSPGDIMYPEKLEMMEEIARNIKASAKVEKDTFTEIQLTESPQDSLSDVDVASSSKSSNGKLDEKFHTSPADMHGMWYPTVRRVLVCLSKLYRCIDKAIFQGLSQEALEACVRSLVEASNMIKARAPLKPGSSENRTTDAQLFLIKHLLILREQIAPFQAEFAIRETQLDFSRTKDAAFRFVLEPKLIPNLLSVSSNALLQFVYEGAPEVKEFYIDSKKDVDRQLKSVCENFIEHQTMLYCQPLSEFLQKASKLVSMNQEDSNVSVSLRQQDFASAEQVQQLVGGVYRNLKLMVKKTAYVMSLYLANKETEKILFKPIKLNVQHVFQQLNMLLLENYSDEDKAIIAAPTSDQIALLMSTAFK